MQTVPRNGDDARRRLQGAALELWSERGYERTTTAEIAARAGVTTRTFFRHFPDKREVLFDSGGEMRDILVATVAAAPAELTPLKVLQKALSAVEPLFEQNRPYASVRQKVIAETPALQERELAKAATLAAALAAALHARGVEPRRASLAAQAAMAAFAYAATCWSEDAAESLDIHVARAFDELGSLASS
jgi:AcrR family transcriptional regulator